MSSQFLPSKGTLDPAPLGRVPSSRFAGEPDWDRYDTRKNEFTLSVQQQLNETWKLAAIARKTRSASVTREIYTSVGPIPDDAGNIARTIHAADRETDVLAADVRLEGHWTLGPTRHELAVGIDHQDALWEEHNYYSQNGVGSINLYNPVYGNVGTLDLSDLPLTDRPDNKIVQTGIYLMDHLTWGRWVVSGAVRHDRARNELRNVSGSDDVGRHSANTGRLGLMYKLDNGLSPYVSFSNAFLLNLGTNGSATAGFLKPTTGKQKEAGVKYLADDGKTWAALAWFDIEQKNRVINGAVPGGQEQTGATTRGWELELRHRVGSLELTGNYTRMNAVDKSLGTRLSSIAEKTASAWAQYWFGANWRAGLGARYTGDVTGSKGVPVVPSVSLFDAMVGYSTGNWDVRADVKNLADKQYVSWCRGLNQDCGYGERLNANVTVRYRF